MLAKPLLSQILHNEALTRHLNDPEARLLVEWLVERAECLPDSEQQQGVDRLCRRARSIGRFVGLWCHERLHGAAIQLAASERFDWPLPAASVDPCDLIYTILTWESRRLAT